MKYGDFKKLTSIKTPASFRAHLGSLGLDMPCDKTIYVGAASPLAAPLQIDCMHPLLDQWLEESNGKQVYTYRLTLRKEPLTVDNDVVVDLSPGYLYTQLSHASHVHS